ncbi:MAG: hypothetical protein CFE35_21300 [Novosphingobium sp. PASSN1]|nr:MAG: hypothetical protein CFE35_21300 [Novosphingobium sp. PASSN1]
MPDPEDLVEAPKSSIFQRRRNTSDAAPALAQRRRKAPQPPVTAHRLFPAFAAIWFAALFGLGGLAISGEVLGALVVKLGLPALVPAAAPPLGFTAHVLVAFALTVVGGLLGLVLGLRLRQRSEAPAVVVAAPPPVAEPEVSPATAPTPAPAVADPYKVRARDAHPDAPPRRPLVLTEAFADTLADTGAEDLAEPEAPLLRRKPFADLPKAAAWMPEFTPGSTGTIQPLDLAVLDLAEQFDDADGDVPEADAEPQELASESQPETHPEAAPEAAVLPHPAAPTLIAATPQLPTGFAEKLPELPNGSWSPVAAAPLENLGLVQLIERLALAMAARSAPTDTDADAGVQETEALAAPEYVPGPFSGPQPSASPASAPQQGSARDMLLRRLGAMAPGDTPADAKADHSLVSDGAPPFSRPAARLPAEAPAEAAATLRSDQIADSAAPQVAASAGASLAASGPFETDEALRSALATLQRMTARA